MTNKSQPKTPAALDDADLSDVQGGITLDNGIKRSARIDMKNTQSSKKVVDHKSDDIILSSETEEPL